MPQLDVSTFPTQLFWLAITILAYFLWSTINAWTLMVQASEE